MEALGQRFEEGGVVLLDGGTGTELEKRGVPMDDAAWCATALATHPEVVRGVHEDYIRAGAEVIITNTFPAAKHVLQEAGVGGRFRELNTRAAELAREARENAAEGPVYVAGSISTFPARLDYGHDPDEREARANYTEQAEVLAEAGVDLIALEMMRDLEGTKYAIESAKKTGLPIWLGFSCRPAEDGKLTLWSGRNSLAETLKELPLQGVSLVSIMHTQIEDTAPALQEIKEHWDGPVGAYPHRGEFIMPHWQFIDRISPEEFAAEARAWIELGAQVVGGCCGIGPEHILELKRQLGEGGASPP